MQQKDGKAEPHFYVMLGMLQFQVWLWASRSVKQWASFPFNESSNCTRACPVQALQNWHYTFGETFFPYIASQPICRKAVVPLEAERALFWFSKNRCSGREGLQIEKKLEGLLMKGPQTACFSSECNISHPTKYDLPHVHFPSHFNPKRAFVPGLSSGSLCYSTYLLSLEM